MYIKYDYLTKEQRSAYESLKDSLRSNPIEVPKKLRDRLEEINRFFCPNNKRMSELEKEEFDSLLNFTEDTFARYVVSVDTDTTLEWPPLE